MILFDLNFSRNTYRRVLFSYTPHSVMPSVMRSPHFLQPLILDDVNSFSNYLNDSSSNNMHICFPVNDFTSLAILSNEDAVIINGNRECVFSLDGMLSYDETSLRAFVCPIAI